MEAQARCDAEVECVGRELNTAELVHAAQRTEMKAEARRAEAAAARLQEDLLAAKEEMQGYMEQAMAEEVRTAGLQAICP